MRMAAAVSLRRRRMIGLNRNAAGRDPCMMSREDARAMQLSRFQLSELAKLLDGEQPLWRFCDSDEGERLCRSGLVAIHVPAGSFRAVVSLSECGRAALRQAC